VELTALVGEELLELLDVGCSRAGRPFREDRAHVLAKAVVVPVAPAEAHDAQLARQQSEATQVEQRRHDLAREQIPCGPENHKDGWGEVLGTLAHERASGCRLGGLLRMFPTSAPATRQKTARRAARPGKGAQGLFTSLHSC